MSLPTMEEMVSFVEKYDKRVGLRLIYKKFNIEKKSSRDKFKQLWDDIIEATKGAKDAAREGIQSGSSVEEHIETGEGGPSTETGDSDSNEPIWEDEEAKAVDPFSPSQEIIPVKKKPEEKPYDDEDSVVLINSVPEEEKV